MVEHLVYVCDQGRGWVASVSQNGPHVSFHAFGKMWELAGKFEQAFFSRMGDAVDGEENVEVAAQHFGQAVINRDRVIPFDGFAQLLGVSYAKNRWCSPVKPRIAPAPG